MFLSPASEIWAAARMGRMKIHLLYMTWSPKFGTWGRTISLLVIITLLIPPFGKELDRLNEDSPCCATHVASMKDKVEKESLFELLVGLNDFFDDIRGRILSRKPLPMVRATFALLWGENSRKRVMLKAMKQCTNHLCIYRFANGYEVAWKIWK